MGVECNRKTPREATMTDRLNRREQDRARIALYKQARKECEAAIFKFQECSKGRTISVTWACRDQMAELNECLAPKTNTEAVNAAFEAYADNLEKERAYAALVRQIQDTG